MKKAPQLNQQNGLAVVPIEGKGRGVVATRDFKKGEVVEIAPALYVPAGDADVLAMTMLGNYLFSGSNGGSCIGLGFSSLYNHTKKSNCDYIAGDKVIRIWAIKNIKAGDELTIDYGWTARELNAAGVKEKS